MVRCCTKKLSIILGLHLNLLFVFVIFATNGNPTPFCSPFVVYPISYNLT